MALLGGEGGNPLVFIMKPNDAYFAGLIDGEGSMGFFSRGSYQSRCLVVEVSMTCHRTIAALHRRFGGQIRSKKTAPGCKPQWMWRCVGHPAVTVLRIIHPYSLTRRQHIKHLLAEGLAYKPRL